MRDRVVAIVNGGGDPITFLANVVQDETVELPMRMQAAAIVLPYIAPRQSVAVVAHAQTGVDMHRLLASLEARLAQLADPVIEGSA